MKIIKYKFLSCEINHGTEAHPCIEQVFLDKEIKCAEDALESCRVIAAAEAYNGEYTIEEAEASTELTQEERIAELEEALELLLAGVTE